MRDVSMGPEGGQLPPPAPRNGLIRRLSDPSLPAMERHELARALRWTVAVLLGLGALAALAPWWLGAGRFAALAAALATPHPHGSCPLCGMTTAFLALARGDLSAAHAANPFALPLWLAMLLAPAVALAVAALRRGAPTLTRRP